MRTVQVRRSCCARTVSPDLPGIQLAVAFQLVSSCSLRPSLRRPPGLVSHLSGCHRHRSGASDRARWLPISTCSPRWPPGPSSRSGGFVSTSPPLPSRPRPIPSYSVPSTMSWRSESTCSSAWPPGPVSRRSAFVSTTLSSLTPVGRSCTLCSPPGMAVSPSSSSGVLLGESLSFHCSERSDSRSDASYRFISQFPVSQTLPDAPNVSISALVSTFSELATPSSLRVSFCRFVGSSDGSEWPPGPSSRPAAFVLTLSPLPSCPWPIPSYPMPSTTFTSSSPSLPLCYCHHPHHCFTLLYHSPQLHGTSYMVPLPRNNITTCVIAHVVMLFFALTLTLALIPSCGLGFKLG